MRFYFHIVSTDTVYVDAMGVECESLSVAVDQARAAVAEAKAEEGLNSSTNRYLIVTCSQPEVVVLLPLEES